MPVQRTKIYRQPKKSNYTVVHNEVLKRQDLSWKAKGIMVYILSLPDDWDIYLEEIMRHATDKKASFRSGWKELKEKKYVERIPVRNKGKIVEWRTIINESVDLTTIPPLTDFQEVEKLEVEKLEVENQPLLSTNNTKYLSKQNTNNTNKPSATTNINIYQQIETEFGRMLSPIERQTIQYWVEEDGFSDTLIQVALREAVLKQAYNLKYMNAILITWEKKNIKTAHEAKKSINQFNQAKQQHADFIPENSEPKVPLYNWLEDLQDD